MPVFPNKSVFSSNRERYFWIGSLVVVVSIYSTLGLTGKLSRELRNHDLLGVAFAGGFLLIIVAIIGSGIAKRKKWQTVWAALGVGAVYGMVMTRMFISLEERTHLIEYGIVAVLIYRALDERIRNGRRLPRPAILAIAITAILGWIDEAIQALLPNRVYDIRDVGFNALAGLMAIVAIWIVQRVRQIRTVR